MSKIEQQIRCSDISKSIPPTKSHNTVFLIYLTKLSWEQQWVSSRNWKKVQDEILPKVIKLSLSWTFLLRVHFIIRIFRPSPPFSLQSVATRKQEDEKEDSCQVIERNLAKNERKNINKNPFNQNQILNLFNVLIFIYYTWWKIEGCKRELDVSGDEGREGQKGKQNHLLSFFSLYMFCFLGVFWKIENNFLALTHTQLNLTQSVNDSKIYIRVKGEEIFNFINAGLRMNLCRKKRFFSSFAFDSLHSRQFKRNVKFLNPELGEKQEFFI